MDQTYISFEIRKLIRQKFFLLLALVISIFLLVGFVYQFYAQKQFLNFYRNEIDKQILANKRDVHVDGNTRQIFNRMYQRELQDLKNPAQYFKGYFRSIENNQGIIRQASVLPYSANTVGFDVNYFSNGTTNPSLGWLDGSNSSDSIETQSTAKEMSIIKNKKLYFLYPSRLLSNETIFNNYISAPNTLGLNYNTQIHNYQKSARLYLSRFYTYGWNYLYSILQNQFLPLIFYFSLILVFTYYLVSEFQNSLSGTWLLTQKISKKKFFFVKYAISLISSMLLVVIPAGILIFITFCLGRSGSLNYPIFFWKNDPLQAGYYFKTIGSSLLVALPIVLLTVAFLLSLVFLFGVWFQQIWATAIFCSLILFSSMFINHWIYVPITYFNTSQAIDGYSYFQAGSGNQSLTMLILLTATTICLLIGYLIFNKKRSI
ncbi:ABC transporter permease [Oenococcus kitaharae]|uniref:ABC transporter permease n=1 Tax=Oenococcus kitaharae DSM 17330 TaxID=1045004 RepID=G9WJ72_9LACO|nr:ABC transporter permease [Oenococcus kitaharae]EHN58521.1 hypothetical protein OKIT_0400 [Oenococcus kitaharae DSM 17330]OEY81333.1 hypothetical protein NT95_07365 [Oenococcus kitaharae]OEY82821.1 hypothetical protein NV75_05465 [Oenococcus kitaharae]OEY84635.1 hypothetical protein NT96_05170 [Oenococcus kitaharae]